jgi:hypothetical protein
MRFPGRVIDRAVCFGAMLLLLGAVTGCGGKGKVSGMVTGPDGQPLPLGRITFLPDSGPPGVSGEIQDGKYAVEDLSTGPAKVSVETAYIHDENQGLVKAASKAGALTGTGASGPPPKDAPPAFAEMQKKQAEGLKIAKEKLAKYREIPEKFADPKTSGLSLTVKSGNNDFPVDLKK